MVGPAKRGDKDFDFEGQAEKSKKPKSEAKVRRATNFPDQQKSVEQDQTKRKVAAVAKKREQEETPEAPGSEKKIRHIEAEEQEGGATVGKVHVLAPVRLSSQPQERGRVIIIGGHSTAGKTTIINAIMKLDPNQRELGIDITPPRTIYEYLETNHTKFGVSKEDWQHLHDVLIPRDENYHIHDAVDEGQFQFRNEASEIDKARAKTTADKLRDPCKKFIEALPHSSLLVMNKAHELAGHGKNVVMDTVNIDKLEHHPLDMQGQVTKVLVYCTFTTLSNRLKQRTREALDSGHPENVRAGTFPLHQYLEIFGPRKKGDKEEDVIDTVSRETVERVIEEQFDAGIEDLKRRNPQEYSQKIADGSIATEKVKEKTNLLEAFGFTPLDPMHKTVQLTPRLHWTMRVDTSNGPVSEETARTILDKGKHQIE